MISEFANKMLGKSKPDLLVTDGEITKMGDLVKEIETKYQAELKEVQARRAAARAGILRKQYLEWRRRYKYDHPKDYDPATEKLELSLQQTHAPDYIKSLQDEIDIRERWDTSRRAARAEVQELARLISERIAEIQKVLGKVGQYEADIENGLTLSWNAIENAKREYRSASRAYARASQGQLEEWLPASSGNLSESQLPRIGTVEIDEMKVAAVMSDITVPQEKKEQARETVRYYREYIRRLPELQRQSNLTAHLQAAIPGATREEIDELLKWIKAEYGNDKEAA